mgnify:FL=1
MKKRFLIKTLLCGQLLLLATLASMQPAGATPSSVTLTPAVPDTLSNGKAYYVAGKPYTFRVQAVNASAAADTDWSSITLHFRTGGAGTEQEIAVITIGAGSDSATTQTGIVVDSIVSRNRTLSLPWSNLDYDITLRFLWNCPAFNAVATNNVHAIVADNVAPAGSATHTRYLSYGVCSTVAIRNFVQTGVAADARINPYHSSFTVTGTIVYSVPGEVITNNIHSINAGEVAAAGSVLRLDGVDTAITAAGSADSFTFTVPGSTVGTLGDHLWTVRVNMTTGSFAGNVVSANSLAFNCNRVEITNIQFTGGGGTTAAPFYRSVNINTTYVTVTARMENNSASLGGNTNMYGATTITVEYGTGIDPPGPVVYTGTFTVTILDNTASATVLIPIPAVGASSTQPYTYRIRSVTGGAYGGDTDPAPDNGQSNYTRVIQSTVPLSPVTIYWDNNDPPGANAAPFTAWVGASATAYSITLSWTPLNPVGGPPYDGDFYTYRIYYRKSVPANQAWTMIDRSTANYGLGGAGDTYRLDLVTTGTADITGIDPLTNYDYYVTAVDLFGQEVVVAGLNPFTASNATYFGAPNAAFYGTINTLPASLTVSLTDGIDTYGDSTFTADPNPSARPFRKTAIRVDAYVVTAVGVPDSVNIIVAANGLGIPLWDAGWPNQVNPVLTLGTDYYRINCTKAAPNKWTGYIPDTNPLISLGSDVKFIVETVKNGVASYADHDSESETPPGDPNNYPYRFQISKQTAFTPWPVRILNNVLTDAQPRAYPSYYLTDDAYVTIKAYDIKGRQVATLLDGAFRKGGQNIKEGGWDGSNRSGRKLGVGLYYIHIQAKRASDGKVILNKFKKVVMAR